MKTIEGLYELAYRAYSNLSFDPEKRAARIVSDYEKQLSEDLETIPENEQEQYIANYKNICFLGFPLCQIAILL